MEYNCTTPHPIVRPRVPMYPDTESEKKCGYDMMKEEKIVVLVNVYGRGEEECIGNRPGGHCVKDKLLEKTGIGCLGSKENGARQV